MYTHIDAYTCIYIVSDSDMSDPYAALIHMWHHGHMT